MRHLSAIAVLGFLSVSVSAQKPTPINLQLRNYLGRQHAPGEAVDLFIRGEERAVSEAVAAQGGWVKMRMNGLVSATVPVDRVEALALDPSVRTFEFSLSKGHTLNDSMRVKTRITDIHAGTAPLLQGYRGEGTIVGIIDTGMDLNHPDFNDSLGNTRVLHYWDQSFSFDNTLTPLPYGYGQAWDSAAINAGACTATDLPSWYGHGSTVTGTAVGNGLATGAFQGAAPAADIIMVATDFDRANWKASVADAVKYIFDAADALGRPVVINASLGDYYGSHDGLDAAALFIDSLLEAAPGRALVCAAGNSYTIPAYHLRTEVTADTSFTWFAHEQPNITGLGFGAALWEVWADTADFSQVHYAIGADGGTGYARRGNTPYRTMQDNLGVLLTDTLVSIGGNRLAVVETYAELRGAQVHLEVFLPQPDSSAYNWAFLTTGSGSFDVWSSLYFGTSRMVTNLPTPAVFPPIVHYVLPDNDQRIVDSWACSDKVITVANYQNETNYIDYNGLPQSVSGTENAIANASSNGPTRDGRMKPDLAAPGDITFSAGPLDFLATLTSGPGAFKVAPGGFHLRAGGTSIASPVVAGTLALYFQKCPNATYADAGRSIRSSAFGDGFTGTLPNTRWGHGKLNSFAALVRNNELPITADPSPVICLNDSVMVHAASGWAAYTWSSGAVTESFHTAAAGPVSLTVQDASGCQGWSDTLMLIANPPVPAPQLSQVGFTLESTPASTYQWFFNGSPIAGANAMTLDVYDTGDYFVQVSDPNGCPANSDTLLVISTGLSPSPRTDALTLWPVPAKEVVNITMPDDMGASAILELTDAQGRLVVRRLVLQGNGTEQLRLDGLASGLYGLRLFDGVASWSAPLSVR
jgi:hypothetical protein